MKINTSDYHYNSTSQPGRATFKAKEYAHVKTFLKEGVQTLKMYEVDGQDTAFFESMAEKIDLKKLIDVNASKQQIQEWKNIINNAIFMTGFNEPQHTFLMTNENRPCALLTFKEFLKDCHIDFLASWPFAPQKKARLSGTSLLKALFERAQKNNTRKITLSMASNSHVNLFEYYKKMGFEILSSDKASGADMAANKSKFSAKSKELDELIKIQLIDSPKKICLKETMNIDFK